MHSRHSTRRSRDIRDYIVVSKVGDVESFAFSRFELRQIDVCGSFQLPLPEMVVL
jgi:hypothetical protein